MRNIYGRKGLSEEIKKKMRDTNASKRGKKVLLSKDNGKTWVLFPSIAEVSRQEEIPKASVQACYSGRSKHYNGILIKPYQNPIK